MGLKIFSRNTAPPPFGKRNLYFHGMIYAPSRSPAGCVIRKMTPGNATLVVASPSLLPTRFRLLTNGFEADCEMISSDDRGVYVRFV